MKRYCPIYAYSKTNSAYLATGGFYRYRGLAKLATRIRIWLLKREGCFHISCRISECSKGDFLVDTGYGVDEIWDRK